MDAWGPLIFVIAIYVVSAAVGLLLLWAVIRSAVLSALRKHDESRPAQFSQGAPYAPISPRH